MVWPAAGAVTAGPRRLQNAVAFPQGLVTGLVLVEDGRLVEGRVALVEGQSFEIAGVADRLRRLLGGRRPEASIAPLDEFVGAGVGVVLDDADAATGQRPAQLRREDAVSSGLDEGVGAPVDSDPLREVGGPGERHPVVDPEVTDLLLVLPARGAVADDRRRPAAIAELREPEQQALEVRMLVQPAGVDDVRRVVPLGRLDGLDPVEVDRVGDHLQPFVRNVELQELAASEPRGRDDPARPGERLARRPLAGVGVGGVVPLREQRRPCERRASAGSHHRRRRPRDGVNHVRVGATDREGNAVGEPPGVGRVGDDATVVDPVDGDGGRDLLGGVRLARRVRSELGFSRPAIGLRPGSGTAGRGKLVGIRGGLDVRYLLVALLIASGVPPRRSRVRGALPPPRTADGDVVTPPGQAVQQALEAARVVGVTVVDRLECDHGDAHTRTEARPRQKSHRPRPGLQSRGREVFARARGSRAMSFDVARYLSVRSAYGASWGPDGETLAFLLDTTGVPQLWTLEEPGGWPDQRTAFEERVTFVDASPSRREVTFGMDQGGNERTQLHRLDLDTGEIDDWTRAPEAKHRWGGWDGAGDRFAFASNRRKEAVFDVYVQDRTDRGEEARLVAEGEGWLSLAGWSPSDDRLLVHEARSSFDHDLHALDLATGDLRQLTDHDGEIRYGSPEWAPDGESVFVATDLSSDTTGLARLDVASGEVETVWTGGEWNVDGVVVDEDSDLIVASRNVDGETDLAVGRLAGETSIDPLPTPDLPGAIAGGVDVAPDGDRFAITATGRRHNANVYVVDALEGGANAIGRTGGAVVEDRVEGFGEGFGEGSGEVDATAPTERWTAAPTAGIPRETFLRPELVRYETFDDREIPALFTLPERASAEGETVPVVVDVHGGPESQRRPSFSALQQYFLGQGYAVFEPNVRGSTGYGRAYTHLDDVERRMDAVADLEAAHQWLVDRPAVDPDRIAIKGGSYGGFMVLAAMTEYPQLWAAGVDVVGIANFVTFLENTGDWRRELREAEYGSLEDDRELLEEISPINRIDRIEAPLFVAHGANDPRVPVGEAEQIAEAARDQGVPVEFLVFEDEGHGFAKLENRIESAERIAAFLDEHV